MFNSKNFKMTEETCKGRKVILFIKKILVKSSITNSLLSQ